MKKIKIYVDLDGTILDTRSSDYPKVLLPGAIDLLEYLDSEELIEPIWLSHCTKGGKCSAFLYTKLTLEVRIFIDKWEKASWVEDKSEALKGEDLSKVLWIDDDISREDFDFLKEKDASSVWLRIDESSTYGRKLIISKIREFIKLL